MSKQVRILIDEEEHVCSDEHSLLAVMWNAGIRRCGLNARGQERFALCGMGVCFECEVDIDGLGTQRACMTTCRDGLIVSTQSD